MSKRAMCHEYKAIITAPGNGVWSWATKFNLLCNSVSLLLHQEALHGESWETRGELQLREGKHFLGLTTNESALCDDVKRKVLWIQRNPDKAREVAMNARALVLERLSRDAVLRDFSKILLQYARLYHTEEGTQQLR